MTTSTDTQHDDHTRILLSAHDLTVYRDAHRVLDQVGITVRQSGFTALIGANGSGKTTLLMALLGSIRIAEGSVTRPSRSKGTGGIGYVPQHVDFDPDIPLTVWDTVALGIDGGRLGFPRRDRAFRDAVTRALQAVDIDHLAGRPIGGLSGGQQQRALIAHALVASPQVLLMDEPLSSLDPPGAQRVVDVVDKARRAYGTAVLMSSHDVTPLLPYADTVAYLRAGHLTEGPTDDIITTDVLTRLYQQPVEVGVVNGRRVLLPLSASERA